MRTPQESSEEIESRVGKESIASHLAYSLLMMASTIQSHYHFSFLCSRLTLTGGESLLGESINKNVTVSLFARMEGVPPCRTKQMEQTVHSSSLTLRFND